jgi:hypothetical protein
MGGPELISALGGLHSANIRWMDAPPAGSVGKLQAILIPLMARANLYVRAIVICRLAGPSARNLVLRQFTNPLFWLALQNTSRSGLAGGAIMTFAR